MKKLLLPALALLYIGCAPVSGPDKTFTGGFLGSGWGTGVGAVIGNQAGAPGAGAALGAGFGLVSGLLTGAGHDIAEGYQLKAERRLASLESMSSYNQSQIDKITGDLKRAALIRDKELDSPFVEVFFDEKRASLLRANVLRLEKLASHVRNKRIGSYSIQLKGYSTDFQTRSTNRSLIEARMKTVETLLLSYGIPAQYIKKDEVDGIMIKQDDSLNPQVGDLVTSIDGDGSRLNNRVEVFVDFSS